MSFYIDFFMAGGIPWYLLAMCVWYISLPLIDGLKPKAVIAGTLFFSLLAGYQKSVGSFLAMSRVIAFAPFFYAGYFVDGEYFKKWLRELKTRNLLFIYAIVCSIFLFLFSYDYLKPFTNLFWGFGYAELGNLYPVGALLRLLWYGIAVLLSLGFMAAIPEQPCIYTKIGSRTLQIYILHALMRFVMRYLGIYTYINAHYSKTFVFLVLISAFPTAIVLGNSWFEKAFNTIRHMPDLLFRYIKK